MENQINNKNGRGRSGRIDQHTGTAQLGGILASLHLNTNAQQRHGHRQQAYQCERNVTKLEIKSPSATKVPTHLNVPINHAALMSPLQSPTFTSSWKRKTRKSLLKSDNSQMLSISCSSASGTSAVSATSGRDTVNSAECSRSSADSSSLDVTTPSSKSHTLGSEDTESEVTQLKRGIGLKNLQSPTSSDEDYEDDTSSEGSEDDNASFVSEDYVPYGRSPHSKGREDQYHEVNEHSYDRTSYIVQEKVIPYGRKDQNTFPEHEEETHISPSISYRRESAQNAVVVDQEMNESGSIVSAEILSHDDDDCEDEENECHADDIEDIYPDDERSHINIEENLETKNQSGKSSKRSFSDYRATASSISADQPQTLELRNALTLTSRGSSSKSMCASTIVRKGKWTMGSRIGQGSFGVVHTAMNNLTGKLMAVKSMNVSSSSSASRSLLNDLRCEIDLMKSLQHPNIVGYFGCEMDRKNQMLHIFQEWVPGGSIASLLHKFGPFPLTVVRTYLYQALLGLSYLHDNHILHRDIKGGNILVNDEGIVKLADFGTSKRLQVSDYGDLVNADDAMANMTICGTPYFMAPEVFEENYGRKADVWSCACVAHQMCTAMPPWKGLGINGPIKLVSFIMKHEGPPPLIMNTKDKSNALSNKGIEPFINEQLSNLFDQCFQRDPSKRPSTQILLEHDFFTEGYSSESVMEDESVRGGSVIGSRSVLSNLSIVSPLKLVEIKRTRATNQDTSNTADNVAAVWPAWARAKASEIQSATVEHQRRLENPFATGGIQYTEFS